MRILILLAALLAFPVHAIEFGPYVARVVRVIDGDTLSVAMIVFPGITVHKHLRLRGVDTPEIRGECEREKRKAAEAAAFVERWAAENPSVRVTVQTMDSFGRAVGSISADGEDLGELLLSEGHARPYGDDSLSWCGTAS